MEDVTFDPENHSNIHFHQTQFKRLSDLLSPLMTLGIELFSWWGARLLPQSLYFLALPVVPTPPRVWASSHHMYWGKSLCQSRPHVPSDCPQRLWCVPPFLGSDVMPFCSWLPGGSGQVTLTYKGAHHLWTPFDQQELADGQRQAGNLPWLPLLDGLSQEIKFHACLDTPPHHWACALWPAASVPPGTHSQPFPASSLLLPWDDTFQ